AHAEGLKEEDYTTESWKNLTTTLNDAKSVLSKGDATQEEVDEAIKTLSKAIDELKLKKDNVSNENNNGNGNGNGNNNNEDGNDSRKDSVNSLPNTGGNSPIALGLFGTITSLVGAFMVKRKR
ncbi:LPXTG cell wall anchor domain-containing protein, partial [Clostridium perfringens]